MIQTPNVQNLKLKSRLVPFLNTLYQKYPSYFTQLQKLLQPNISKENAFQIYLSINQYLLKNNKYLQQQFSHFFQFVYKTNIIGKKNHKSSIRITDQTYDSYSLRKPKLSQRDLSHIDPLQKSIINTKWQTVQFVSNQFIPDQKTLEQQIMIEIQQQISTVNEKIIKLKLAIQKLQEIINNKIIGVEISVIKDIIIKFYGNQYPYHELFKNYKVAQILLPRFKDKLNEIQQLKKYWAEQWITLQNEYHQKSLDRRYVDFRRIDLNLNSLIKWHEQLLQRLNLDSNYKLKQSKQKPIKHNFQPFPLAYYFQNTFGNLLGESFIDSNHQKIPKYINSAVSIKLACQWIFQMEFSEIQIMQDIGFILYQKLKKWNDLPICILLKIFNIGFKQICKPSQTKEHMKILFNQYNEKCQNKKKLKSQRKKAFSFSNYMNMKSDLQLNRNDIIFLGTKQHYYFLRAYLAIYQRFVLAKELKNQIEQITLNNYDAYEIFVSLIRQKTTEKQFLLCLNKIYGSKSHYFSATFRLINNLVSALSKFDQLSYNLSTAGTQTYQSNRDISKYIPDCQQSQLAKLYTAKDPIFIRSYYDQGILYLGGFSNPFVISDQKYSQLQQSDPICSEALPLYSQFDIESVENIPTKKRSSTEQFRIIQEGTKIILKRQVVDEIRKIRKLDEQ